MFLLFLKMPNLDFSAKIVMAWILGDLSFFSFFDLD